MAEEKDAFYVVRKGDIVAIYNSLSDCQAQSGSSVWNPSISVYKGYCLSKDAEEHLASHGLKNATYSVGAADVTDDLFGKLVACPFQQPVSSGVKAADKDFHTKRLQGALDSDSVDQSGSTSFSTNPQKKQFKSDYGIQAQAISSFGEVSGSTSFSTNPQKKQFKSDYSNQAQAISSFGYMKVVQVAQPSCILLFDGASKGNPGQAGAGAVLRAEDGSMVCRLREGVGIATNNVAEYRAVLLGLKHALKKGYKHIRVQGDSKLVCMQIQGLWKTKNQNMADLCKEAKELKDKFVSFQINHVLREFNSEADAQANQAVNLKDGQVEEDCRKM
ncbi:uncharacterized protein LOC126714962 isoform X1 [Quercus robur]|uniref:uncharacterized protein LOC126714962 isoform X1 n=1 Tax=Quercus robur TaxID=38942 RepID=UPI0021624CC8|nr:uncharacterized protein LOC126714962 isoform X1 [Quercus robur]